jgi:hypothetical protein
MGESTLTTHELELAADIEAAKLLRACERAVRTMERRAATARELLEMAHGLQPELLWSLPPRLMVELRRLHGGVAAELKGALEHVTSHQEAFDRLHDQGLGRATGYPK